MPRANSGSFLNTVLEYTIINKLQYRDLLIVLPMREPSIFRGIAVSLLRPVIGSNVEIDVVALNWVADVRKQIAAAFKYIHCNNVRKSLASWKVLFRPLFSLEAAVSVFASTSSTLMSLNNSLKTSPKSSKAYRMTSISSRIGAVAEETLACSFVSWQERPKTTFGVFQ